MRNFKTMAVAAALALGIVGCAGTPAGTNQQPETQSQDATEQEVAPTEGYTYEGIEVWDVQNENMGGMTMREIMTTMAKPETDMDAYIQSQLGEFALASQHLMPLGAIDAPEVAEYWEELGMVHEAHDVDDAAHQWTSLVPKDMEEGKTYPLLFVWHGNGNAILLAEGYGFGESASQRDWMVVFPWADNDDEYLGEFDRILAYMEENYPVDEGRIYTTGFSKGGRVSAHLALERADVLAAAAPNGTTAAASFYNPDGSQLELTGPQQLAASDFEGASQAIPVQFWGGEYDVFGAMPYDAGYKIDGINGWLGLWGIDHAQSLEASEELLASSNEATEHATGLSFDMTEQVESDGTTYHVGSYLDSEGRAVVRVVECDGAIHWPTPAMSDQALDFLNQFSK